MKTPMNKLEYVELYACRMKRDPGMFDDQKRFIESQLRASASLFRSMFSGKDFKKLGRVYLRRRGLL